MRFIRNKLNTPFARKWGAIIGFGALLLVLSNPELLSFVLLVNMIGVDVFVLLVGIQLRHNWSAINTFIINPFYFKVKRLFSCG